jgi:hypothetical protein
MEETLKSRAHPEFTLMNTALFGAMKSKFTEQL